MIYSLEKSMEVMIADRIWEFLAENLQRGIREFEQVTKRKIIYSLEKSMEVMMPLLNSIIPCK